MSSKKILIVDTQAEAAAELDAMLRRLGYDIAATAASGPEAIGLIERTEPALIMMDAALDGEMDGFRAAEAIRARRPIPIIFTTAATAEPTVQRLDRTHPFSYVLKPFREGDVRVHVDAALADRDTPRPMQELEERFFTVSLDLLCCLDFNGYFKELNPAWERALGFTIEELKSRPFIEFVHPDDRERTLRQNRAVRTGGQALGFENRYLCKDGSYRWLLWNAAPDAPELVIYSVARDITERKRAEEERERLVGELQAALAEVQALQEILPICSYCRKVRDDANYWHTVEAYIATHTKTMFSHSVCPSCYTTHVEPQFGDEDE